MGYHIFLRMVHRARAESFEKQKMAITWLCCQICTLSARGYFVRNTACFVRILRVAIAREIPLVRTVDNLTSMHAWFDWHRKNGVFWSKLFRTWAKSSMFVYNSRFTALTNKRKILRHQKRVIDVISVGKLVRVIVAYHRFRAGNF